MTLRHRLQFSFQFPNQHFLALLTRRLEVCAGRFAVFLSYRTAPLPALPFLLHRSGFRDPPPQKGRCENFAQLHGAGTDRTRETAPILSADLLPFLVFEETAAGR